MAVIDNQLIRECYDFAITAWKYNSQSQKQFGTNETRQRNAFIADQLSGKMAEYIFKKEIEDNYGNVEVQLNFNHYLNPLHTDNGDVTINQNGHTLPYRLDIKGSSSYAQWLLVERHKFNDLQTGLPMSDRYVMVQFSNEMPSNPQLRRNPESILDRNYINGKIAGWANHNDFISPRDGKPWFKFQRGDRPWKRRVLPASNTVINDLRHLRNSINYRIRQSKLADDDIYLSVPLDAELNYGLPLHWLNKDRKQLLDHSPAH